MTTGFLFADEMDLAGQRVLLRLDVNVPIQDGQVSDDTRIRRIVPGLQALVAARAKIIILTRAPGYGVAAYSEHAGLF